MEKAEALIRSCDLPIAPEALIAALTPRIGLTSYPWAPSAVPPGASRFGGPADLPPGIEWPTAESCPLLLLTQLNFADLAIEPHHPTVRRLPRQGWLCLFLDTRGFDSGIAGSDPGVVALQFGGDPARLIRHDPPPPPDAHVWTQCHRVTVCPADHQVCLPSHGAVDAPPLADDDEDTIETYADLVFAISDLKRTRHDVTLLGSPTLYNPDPRHAFPDPEAWMLLLEFEGESAWLAGVATRGPFLDRPSLGDGTDFLQYFVRRDDYEAGRLDRGRFAHMGT